MSSILRVWKYANRYASRVLKKKQCSLRKHRSYFEKINLAAPTISWNCLKVAWLCSISIDRQRTNQWVIEMRQQLYPSFNCYRVLNTLYFRLMADSEALFGSFASITLHLKSENVQVQYQRRYCLLSASAIASDKKNNEIFVRARKNDNPVNRLNTDLLSFECFHYRHLRVLHEIFDLLCTLPFCIQSCSNSSDYTWKSRVVRLFLVPLSSKLRFSFFFTDLTISRYTYP